MEFPDREIACVIPLFGGYSDPHGSCRISEDHEKQARKLLADASAKIQYRPLIRLSRRQIQWRKNVAYALSPPQL